MTTRMWRCAGLFACSVALHTAAAQDSLRFSAPDAEISRQVSQIIESAAAAGLPAGQILSKARFALLVRTPGPKIVETAKAVAARLEIARRSIAPHELANDIVSGEEALSYDVPPEILRQISLASPKAPIAVPLSLLTQLVANRVPARQAGEIVTKLVRRGATPAQMLALGNDVDVDVRMGGFSPGDAVNVRFKNLSPHLAPPSASASATDLGFTSSPSGPKKP